MRCAPPVTSAACGTGGTDNAPVGSGRGPASPAGTTFLPRPHLFAGHIPRREACASRNRPASRALGALGAAWQRDPQAAIDLLAPTDLFAQPPRLFQFQ